MRRLLQTLSGFALAGTIVPPLLHFAGMLPLDRVRLWMGASALVWFAATPLWMDRDTRG